MTSQGGVGSETIARPLLWGPAITLAHRELRRFYRQRDRVLGAIAQPILMWLLFGAGLQASFRPGAAAGAGLGAMEYLLPGTAIMIVLFTAIFSTISVIEDRNEGFLQGVLAAPVRRSAIILGKVLGSTALAVPQGVLVLALGPLVGMRVTPLSLAAAAGVLTLVSIALSGVGLCIAWRMDSTQGFHAIMTIFLFPMWVLSGAFFPVAGTPLPLRVLMTVNPLTYGMAALRHVLYGGSAAGVAGLPGLPLCLALTGLFGALTFGLSVVLASRPSRGRGPA